MKLSLSPSPSSSSSSAFSTAGSVVVGSKISSSFRSTVGPDTPSVTTKFTSLLLRFPNSALTVYLPGVSIRHHSPLLVVTISLSWPTLSPPPCWPAHHPLWSLVPEQLHHLPRGRPSVALGSSPTQLVACRL